MAELPSIFALACRLAPRARSQRGMTLPLTLGVLMVLGIVAATVATVGFTGEQSTRRMTSEQKAFALAEGGLEQAVSYLYRATDPAVPTAIVPGSQSENGGTMSWSGSLAGDVWTLTGTGTVPSGVVGAPPVTRTASAQYRVNVAGTAWEYNYADSSTGCMTISNNAEFASPLYLRGNLCLSNSNSRFTGQKLHVEGTVTMNNGRIGASGVPIASANIVGGCTGGSPNPHPCTTADRVYATSNTQVPGTVTKPTVNLDYWYANAAPGPNRNCTIGSMPGGFDNDGVRNGSRPQFDLTPGSSYDCRVTDAGGNIIGRLSWTTGSPGTLTIAGTIFFDGNIWTSGQALYSGRGTIYASGKVEFSIGATLCGVSNCTSAWTPATNLITLVAGSSGVGNTFLISNNAKYQGAGYAVGNYYLSNNAENWGPVVANQITIENNAGQVIPLSTLPPGSPGTEQTIQMISASWRG